MAKICFLLICVMIFVSSGMDLNLDDEWETYKERFSKKYEKDEEQKRRMTWEDNVMYIIRHNLKHDVGLVNFTTGINRYSDMEHQELISKLCGLLPHNKTLEPTNDHLDSLLTDVEESDDLDLRKEGLVTEVKNQGSCGSCWAFATVGNIEGFHKRKTGKLVSLSEQNLVDCTPDSKGVIGDGCAGNTLGRAMDYVEKEGIDTEESYPYEGNNGKCRFKKENVGATCSGHSIIFRDEKKMKLALSEVGPYAAGVAAVHSDFFHYKSGVYTHPKCTGANHGILIVGYGNKDEKDYWIIKNSWGKSWGESGYMKIRRNTNECEIGLAVLYVI